MNANEKKNMVTEEYPVTRVSYWQTLKGSFDLFLDEESGMN